jgi:drug/metabolite transporter (DMT)-like permease
MIFVALRYTTATFVTAFSNVSPVLTFLLAVATRSETLNLRTGTGGAKLVGTLVSVAGAMVLTFYKGVPLTPTPITLDLLLLLRRRRRRCRQPTPASGGRWARWRS